MFKALQSERTDSSDLPSDYLSAEEFSHLFECLGMKWAMVSCSDFCGSVFVLTGIVGTILLDPQVRSQCALVHNYDQEVAP